MKLHLGLSVLAASAVLLVSDAALSLGQTTTVNELMDFNTSTGELFAYPQGQALATYQHRPATQHLIANIAAFLPPDPCFPLVEAWNFTARFDARYHIQSGYVFEVLLQAMSNARCHAQVTSVTSFLARPGSPPLMVSVLPVAK
jgi:hypothetical protein